MLSIPSVLTLAPAGLCGPTDETGVEMFRFFLGGGAQHCQFSPWQLQVCGCREREQGWCPCCPSPGWLLWPDARWLHLDCPLSPPCRLPPPTLPSPPCRGEEKEKRKRTKMYAQQVPQDCSHFCVSLPPSHPPQFSCGKNS